MTSSDKPQIEDLKRLLERLEHVTPENERRSADKPAPARSVSPPPLPPSAAPPPAESASPKHPLALAGEPRASAAIAPAARPPARSPLLPWAATTAAGCLAGAAGLGFWLWHNAEDAKRQANAPIAAVARIEQPPAPTTTLAEARAKKNERVDAGGAQPAPARQIEAPSPAAAAAEPKPTAAQPPAATVEPPAPAQKPAESVSTQPPASLGEAAIMRVEPQQGRDKFDSEARLDAYLERGQKLIDEGDLTAARAFFRRAAESGDPRGALALGATYDANYFAELGIRNARPDAEAASLWYRKAMDLGSKDAMDRIDRLGEK